MAALDGWRDWRDAMVEATFHATYGSPVIQALLGLRASDDPPRARPGREPEEIAFVQQRIAELEGRMGQGGLREAFVRAIIYIRLPELAADERGFAVLSKLREEHASDLSLADFKALVRDQFLMLELDEAQAVATIPLLLQGHGDQAAKALELLESVVTAPGPLGAGSRRPARADRRGVRRPRVGPGQSPAPAERGRRQGCCRLTFPTWVGTLEKLLRERGALMTTKTRRAFSDEFKREAVSLLEGSGRPG